MNHPTAKADPEFLAHMKPILLKRKQQLQRGSDQHRQIINALWRIRYNIKKGV
jgi:hypothetical protein